MGPETTRHPYKASHNHVTFFRNVKKKLILFSSFLKTKKLQKKKMCVSNVLREGVAVAMMADCYIAKWSKLPSSAQKQGQNNDSAKKNSACKRKKISAICFSVCPLLVNFHLYISLFSLIQHFLMYFLMRNFLYLYCARL